MPVEYRYGGPVGSKGWGPNSPSGALGFADFRGFRCAREPQACGEVARGAPGALIRSIPFSRPFILVNLANPEPSMTSRHEATIARYSHIGFSLRPEQDSW